MLGEGRGANSRARREAAAEAAVASTCSAGIGSTSTSTGDNQGWEEVGKSRHRSGARKQQQQQQQQQQQRLSTKPQAKHAAPVVGTRRGGGVGDSSNGSSRQQPGRSASSRREYTLFDHLLMARTPPPPSRRSGVNPSLRPGGASQRPAPPPGEQGKSTRAPPAAPPGAQQSKKLQRSRPPPRQGDLKPGDRGATAFQQVLNVSGSAALLGGGVGGCSEGGRFKKAGPSLSTSARQKGGHAPPTRVVTKSSDAPKPGKQRLGPRKKKLSPLKKKILLDRLGKWRAIQNDSASAADVDGQGVCPSSLRCHAEEETSPSLSPPAGAPCGGDIVESGAGGYGGGGGETRLWVVAIYNLVDEEDVEDDDDHAEVERDLWEMASTFGAARSVEVPRGAAHFGGAGGLPAAKVAFATAEEAEQAKRGFHGRIVGGKSLRVEVEERGISCRGDTSNSGNPDAPAAWRVAVENLIDEDDDLDDDDEYAEVCADISAMMAVHGTLLEVDVPRRRLGENEEGIDGHTIDGAASTDEKPAAAAAGYVVVVTYGSLEEAEACVEDINGRRVGGKELNASLTTRQSRVGSESSGHTQHRRDDVPTTATAAGREGSAIRAGAAQAAARSPSADAETTPVGGAAWRVVIRNLIDEDDLIDDDDYGEVRSDTTALVSTYGAVARLCIPRDTDAAGGEEAGAHDEAEPGEAVAVFESLEEAEACARGLSGRKIAGKVIDAQVVSTKPQTSRPGVEPGAGARPGCAGPLLEQRSAKGAPPQSGRPSAAPDVHDSGSRVVRGVAEPPVVAAAAGAEARPSEGVAAAASMKGGRRMPTKYKEAAALPKPPGVSGGGSPNAYVYQSPDKEVDDLVFEMLQLLFKFQERARLADPVKSKTRRRIVMGLREVLRGVKAKKVRLLIVAPNVDAVGGQGGLDEKVVEIIDAAREGEMPVVFALSKRKIGKALGKTIKVSAVGVYSFDGAHEQQKQLKRRIEAIHSLPPPAPLGDGTA